MYDHEHLLWKEENISLEQRDLLAKKIVEELRKTDFFCLWLQGKIGAGKTTLTGSILRSFGLDPRIPVTSPTFTYLSDYKINSKDYAHLDFYRLESSNHPLSDLLNYLDYDGLFIEWPENLGAEIYSIAPTHILRIEQGMDASTRTYTLFELSKKKFF